MERVSTPPVSTPGLWFAVCNVSPPRSTPGSQAELNISAAGKHIGADPELPDAGRGGGSKPDRTVRPFLSGIKASLKEQQKTKRPLIEDEKAEIRPLVADPPYRNAKLHI